MDNYRINELLPSYFEGTLNKEDQEKVEKWKSANKKNRLLFKDYSLIWDWYLHIGRMKKYDPTKALQKVHQKLKFHCQANIFAFLKNVAVIFLVPLLAITIYFANKKIPEKETFIPWHTLSTPAGMRSKFMLPDSSKVILNPLTSLSYPVFFDTKIRKVKLEGEAYFDISNNKTPFVVNAGRIKIEVMGTEFKVSNYTSENLTEIILVEGKINLFKETDTGQRKEIALLNPGERFFYDTKNNKIDISKTEIDKYLAWKEGVLMFRDDPMPEVVRRLNRWFNVDIKLTGPELRNYVYTATFQDEPLFQILELLKISAPINYTIKQRERKEDKTFSKMEIIISQKKQ